MPTPEFRCSVSSKDGGEQIAGTAPAETEWLLVEDDGPWPAKATGHLAHLVAPGGRAQLIRRHGGRSGPGVRVFRASLGDTVNVRTTLVDHLDDVRDLASEDFATYDGPLWLVCTNGRRDVCCAERGRPVAAALAKRWPEATWETTHLGGHRFSATLLALPSALVLGRLDPASALDACAAIEAGAVPLEVSRGRAGWPAIAQYADLHLRFTHRWAAVEDVGLLGVEANRVRLGTPNGEQTVTVLTQAGTERRQSCADLKTKPETHFSVE